MTTPPAEHGFPTGSPESGTELSQALAALLSEGHRRLTPPPASWFFTPQGAAWAPALHIRHLGRASRPLATALRLPRFVLGLRFGRPHAASAGFEAVRQRYVAALDAGATAGPYAPPPAPIPADPVAARIEILSNWSRTTVDLTNAIARWPEHALDRYQLPHPFLGLLTVREMLAFTVYHTAHHLRRIMEREAARA